MPYGSVVTTRRSSTSRVIVASVVGTSVTLLAVVAHLLGHGATPPVLALLTVGVPASVLAYAASGKRLAFSTLLGLIAVSQVGVHELSTYLAGPGPHTTVSMLDSGTMLLAHAVSTVATAAVLAYGDHLWWLLRTWRSAYLMRVEVLRAPIAARPRLRATLATAFSGQQVDGHSVGVRGPPLLTQI